MSNLIHLNNAKPGSSAVLVVEVSVVDGVLDVDDTSIVRPEQVSQIEIPDRGLAVVVPVPDDFNRAAAHEFFDAVLFSLCEEKGKGSPTRPKAIEAQRFNLLTSFLWGKGGAKDE